MGRTGRILVSGMSGAFFGGLVGFIAYEIAHRGFVCNDAFGDAACAGPFLLGYLARGVLVGVVVGFLVGFAIAGSRSAQGG